MNASQTPRHPLYQRLANGCHAHKRRIAILTAIGLAIPIVAFAAPVEIPHHFSSGDVITAESFNENFQALAEAVNENDERLNDVEMDITGSGMPSKAVVFFEADACPEGWSELITMRGRVPLGLPLDGTLGSMVGTDLEDEGTRVITTVPSHSHGTGTLSVTVQSAGVHGHTITGSGNHIHVTSDDGGHTPTIIGNSGSHDHPIQAEPFGGFGTYGVSGVVDSAGGSSTSTPIAVGGAHTHTLNPVPDHNHSIASSGSHTHSIQAGGGSHGHPATMAGNTGSSGVASVDVTMPYMQLLACAKD